jgi:hypothetical protein
MKNILTIATRKAVIILGLATLTAIPVFAQQSKWRFDAGHSQAAVFLGSNSNLQEAGIARVGGNAEFIAGDPSQSVLNFSVRLPQDQRMSFQSTRVEERADGKLQITGKMTLTLIKSDAEYNPGEDYRGPIYGQAVAHNVSREVTFVLPMVDNAEAKQEITAEATLGIESFPELFAAVRQAAWQPVVQDEHCKVAEAREDYRGDECSGKLIAPEYQAAALNPGEDYRGDESPAPSGNTMKIVLQLQLNRVRLG